MVYKAATIQYFEIEVSEHTDFGVNDGKGRSIGYRVEIQRMVVEELLDPPSILSVWPREFGEWHVLRFHLTVDGCDFGASHVSHCFQTLEEAKNAADKAVAKARDKYTKRYGQTATI